MLENDFLNRWNELELIKALPSSRNKFQLDHKSIEFLFDIGLPTDVLELCFDYLKKDLQTINETWQIGDKEFDKYVNIGFNGSGDPIGINTDNGEIVYLNHDDGFREIYINADIVKFAYCSLKMIDFQDNLKNLNPKSYFSTEFSDEQLSILKKSLLDIDSKVFSSNSHWNYTVEDWIWEREDERNKY